ncbi:MAG: ROK family protein [Spirochaetia bacterium]
MSEHFVIGFDLGGTKMLSAVLNEKNEIIAKVKRRTKGQEGNEEVVDTIIDCIKESMKKADIKKSDISGIGIACPGILNRDEGVLEHTPNLGFENFPLREKIQKKIDIPILIENDVNAGTYGEFKHGAGKGFENVIGLFPGTGVGGGLILNGKLFIGAEGNAGELGHMIIQVDGPLCGCGQYGCLEALASRTAITKEAVALSSAGNAPEMYEIAGTDFKDYRSKVFAKAIEKKSGPIIQVIKRSAWFMGIAMGNLVNILNPQGFILGGGLVEKLGNFYIDEAEKSMRDHCMPGMAKNVQVLEASLGDDAVFMGCASLVREYLEKQ